MFTDSMKDGSRVRHYLNSNRDGNRVITDFTIYSGSNLHLGIQFSYESSKKDLVQELVAKNDQLKIQTIDCDIIFLPHTINFTDFLKVIDLINELDSLDEIKQDIFEFAGIKKPNEIPQFAQRVLEDQPLQTNYNSLFIASPALAAAASNTAQADQLDMGDPKIIAQIEILEKASKKPRDVVIETFKRHNGNLEWALEDLIMSVTSGPACQ
jgi:hypothetical protein